MGQCVVCLPANYTLRLLAPNERRNYYRSTLTLHRLRVNLPARARRVQSDDDAAESAMQRQENGLTDTVTVSQLKGKKQDKQRTEHWRLMVKTSATDFINGKSECTENDG